MFDFNTLCCINDPCLLVSLKKRKMAVNFKKCRCTAFALNLSYLLSLESELSFMFLARELEMPLLLTDLFIVSQDFPQEYIENSFSCSLKEIKWAESAVQRKKNF